MKDYDRRELETMAGGLNVDATTKLFARVLLNQEERIERALVILAPCPGASTVGAPVPHCFEDGNTCRSCGVYAYATNPDVVAK